MTGLQVGTFIIAIVVLLLVSVAAQFEWLGNGRMKTVIVFLSGVVVFGALRIGGLPPSWFAGRITGFALAASFIAGAFIGRGEEKSFRMPLFLGSGLVLLIANAVQAITNVL